MSFGFEIQQSVVLDGVWIVTPPVFEDARGTIWTSYLKDEIEKQLPEDLYFKHDKFSESQHNVLRGIHGDRKSWKLVTCVFGEIHQVVVDMREDSPTYLKWQKFLINRNNQILVLIPPNIGNAYYVSSAHAVYHYKLAYQGDYADYDQQFSVRWDDPRIAIDWPTTSPMLSERDGR